MLYIGILLFVGTAFGIVKLMVSEVTFDKASGTISMKKGFGVFFPKVGKMESFDLNDVHALQIISERIKEYDEDSSRGKSAYRSYEINLVLSNKDRIHILDHNRELQIREEAQQLSAFLGVNIWNEDDAKLIPDEEKPH